MRDASARRKIKRNLIITATLCCFVILCSNGLWLGFSFQFSKEKSKFLLFRFFSKEDNTDFLIRASEDSIRKKSYGIHFSTFGNKKEPSLSCENGIPRKIKKKFKANKISRNKHLAICFAGGVREFDLTGLSLVRHVLEYYDARVAFFNIPLDEHTHKISVLLKSKSNIAIHVVTQSPMNETIARLLLNPDGSPNAYQGLLQYFELVEGCGNLISSYQKTHSPLSFKWIFRSRTDSFWNQHPPPMSKLAAGRITFAHGSEFGGINDRVSVGDFNQSMLSFQRLNTFQSVWEQGNYGLNSEQTLHKQILLQGLQTDKAHFPFCVLTRRVYSFFMRKKTTPVGNIGDKRAYLNGIKCRPCIPAATHKKTQKLLKVLNDSWGAVGSNNDFELCDARKPWPSDWESLFDSMVDEETVKLRKHLKYRSYQTCVEENALLRKRVEVYHGPPPSVLCIVGFWGPFEKPKPETEDWFILPKGLSPGSLVYSFGIGKNLLWENAVADRFGSTVRVFDCTPIGRMWEESIQNDTSNLIFQNSCIGQYDGWKIYHALQRSSGMEESPSYYTGIKYPYQGFRFVGEPVRAATRTLTKIMHELKHAVVDLVKVDIGEEVLTVILKDWDRSDDMLPVCQLLIDFSLIHLSRSHAIELKNRSIDVLRKKAMYMVKCFGDCSSEKCLFVSHYFCNI